MNEREQLEKAQEQLKQSIRNAFKDLRTYGKAVASHTGAVYAEKKDDLISRMEFAKLEREMERDIRKRTREHKAGMKEALREYDREQRRERRLQFKQGIKQKTSSVFGKLGQVKNDILAKLSPSNMDVKLRNFYEQVQIKGLEVANKGKEIYNNAAVKVDEFTTEQIAKYYEYQAGRQEKEAQKEFDRQIREQQKLEEAELKARTREHKAGMKEALREYDREQKEFDRQAREQQKLEEAELKARTREHKAGMKEALREYDREQRKERRLQFKQGVKQKTSSVFGKLGQVKNDILVKLSPSNIDVKLRNFYEQVQIKGLEIANKGKEIYNNAAVKVDEFTTGQIAKYYERKEEKREEKEFKEAAKRAEKEEIERIKARVRERKADMKAALNASEREMYETKHLENQARKQELMESLYGAPVEEETVAYAR